MAIQYFRHTSGIEIALVQKSLQIIILFFETELEAKD
jgi:hypothetical protein